MNEAITNRECIESPTRPATIDLPLWITGLAFWTLVAMSFALAVFGAEPRQPRTVTGIAAVNRMGDVIGWDAEKATGKPNKEMLFRDFFQIVPTEKRRAAREMFERALDGPPYMFHELYWHEAGADYSVRFKRTADTYLATIARRE